jgi:hypothetical protein
MDLIDEARQKFREALSSKIDIENHFISEIKRFELLGILKGLNLARNEVLESELKISQLIQETCEKP